MIASASSRLAVAVDSGDAQNFSGVNFEAQAANFLAARFRPGRANLRLAESVRRAGAAICRCADSRRARPSGASAPARRLSPIVRVATTWPSRITVTRSAISMISSSLCVTITTERPSFAELCAARRIADLFPAGSARRWVRRESAGAHRDTEASESRRAAARQWEAIPLRRADRAPGRGDCSDLSSFCDAPCANRAAAPAAFAQAEHRVFDHGEWPHQHEFLMHHADAERDGVFGAARGALRSPSIRISPESIAWKP